MIVKAPITTKHFSVDLPSSKSISNRVLIINALADNNSLTQNLADCDDTNVLREWLVSRPDVIDIGAAGTAMRFSTALLSVLNETHVITGSERMKQRPIKVLVDALRFLGADIHYLENEGFPPLKILGSSDLEGGCVELDGNVSSQFISALMLVAPYMKNGLELRLRNKVISRPYINMTMSIMKDFGADVKWVDDNVLSVCSSKYLKRNYWIENDWSAASYWYEIMALNNTDKKIKLIGLKEDSIQGDAKVADIFTYLGISTTYENNDGIPVAVISKNGNKVDFLEYNFVNQPDLAQTVIVTCCMLDIPFRFTGLESLKIKETDRIAAMINEMSKMGYELKQTNDETICWNGNKCQTHNPVTIDTYKDHRMAMAFAPAALKTGMISVNDPMVVRKSYTGFWNDISQFGFELIQ